MIQRIHRKMIQRFNRDVLSFTTKFSDVFYDNSLTIDTSFTIHHLYFIVNF